MGWPIRFPHVWAPSHFEADFALDVDDPKTAIVETASFVDAALIDRLRRYPDELRTIDRRVFEELIAELFQGVGYDVELTSKTKDGGIDVIAIKNDRFRTKFLIQCKRQEPGNAVDIDVVRNLRGVFRSGGNMASKAIIATTTRLTRDAKRFVAENEWDLEAKEYDDIHAWIREYQSKRGG